MLPICAKINFSKFFTVVGIFSSIMFVTGCQEYDERRRADQLKKSENTDKKNAKASVQANSTQGNTAKAKITFTVVDGGVSIVADAQGLTPGKHGFHVHEFGDCSAADGSSAGGHFNPTKSSHGGPENAERHAGDLGNLVADENGNAHYERVDKVITLSGPNSIIGKSIVIHAGEDDFKTQPSGNSGARVACGVILEE